MKLKDMFGNDCELRKPTPETLRALEKAMVECTKLKNKQHGLLAVLKVPQFRKAAVWR